MEEWGQSGQVDMSGEGLEYWGKDFILRSGSGEWGAGRDRLGSGLQDVAVGQQHFGV